MKSDKNNTSVNSKKVRVYPVATKRLMANYMFYSRIAGFNTISEAVRNGIRMFNEGYLELRHEINENLLPAVEEIEKMHGGRIIEWDDDTSDFEIHMEKNLLKRFDELRLNKGFRSRSKAICAVMFNQIMEWKSAHEAKQKKEAVKDYYIIEGEKKLNQRLEELKQDYELGFELDAVEWLPDSKNNKHGEVKGNKIHIYDETYEEAYKTLEHEFDHYLMNKYFSQPFVDAMNATITFWKKLMEEFNNGKPYKERERLIEKFVEKSTKSSLSPD